MSQEEEKPGPGYYSIDTEWYISNFIAFLSHTEWWYEILFSKEEEKPPWLLFHLQLLEESDEYKALIAILFTQNCIVQNFIAFLSHTRWWYEILLSKEEEKPPWLLFHLQLLEESEEY